MHIDILFHRALSAKSWYCSVNQQFPFTTSEWISNGKNPRSCTHILYAKFITNADTSIGTTVSCVARILVKVFYNFSTCLGPMHLPSTCSTAKSANFSAYSSFSSIVLLLCNIVIIASCNFGWLSLSYSATIICIILSLIAFFYNRLPPYTSAFISSGSITRELNNLCWASWGTGNWFILQY